MLTKEQIKDIIPYDEPFLFVDGVEEIGENTISGFYQTSKDDYYFKGHFVDFKIMPGVLIVEALAQLSTIFLRKKIGKIHKNYHFLAYEVRGVQFLKPIFPGDKIILKDEVLGIYPVRRPNSSEPESASKSSNGVHDNKIAHIKGQTLVGSDLKSEARFSIAIIEKEEFLKRYKK